MSNKIQRDLYLVRHAKSSWDNPELPDFYRCLNERGLRQGQEVATRWAGKVQSVDRMLTSPATRAYQTALFFREAIQLDWENFQIIPRLYEAMPGDWHHTLTELTPEVRSVALFGHNPGISQFSHWLTGEEIEFKTACVAHVQIQCPWNQIEPLSGMLMDYLSLAARRT